MKSIAEKTGLKLTSMLSIFMYERIINEDDYRKAIMRFLEICDAEPGSLEHDEALKLTVLMEEYEKLSCYERHYLN